MPPVTVSNCAALPPAERDAFLSRVGLFTRPSAARLVATSQRLPNSDPMVQGIRAEIAAHQARVAKRGVW